MSTTLVIFVVYALYMLCNTEIHCGLLQSILVIFGENCLQFLDELETHYFSFRK